MDTTRSSRNFFDSIFVCQESILNINLNTPMLMTIDDDILSGDGIFYNAKEPLTTLNRVKADANKAWQFSHTSKNVGNKSLNCFPDTEHYASNKNSENYAVDSLQCSHNITSPNLLPTQHSNPEKENNERSNHFSLNVLLKRIFDNMLGKHSNSAKESKATISNKTFGNEIFLNNSFSMTMLSGTCYTNNSLALYQTPNLDKSISSVENIKDPSKDNTLTNICIKNTPTSFTNKFFPDKLVTILGNSNKNTTNADIEGFSYCSAKYVGRLTKFFPQNLHTKYCMGISIYDATDAEGGVSSNASNNIGLSEQVLLMANNIENNNDSENSNLQYANEMTVDITDISNEDSNIFSDVSLKIKESDSALESEPHDNSVENETSSSWTYSELEESDYSSTFSVTSKIINTELSIIKQSLHEEDDSTADTAIDVKYNEKSIKGTNASLSKVSPILKERIKKRRNLSLPGEVADAKNNKMPNKRLDSTSSPLKRRCKSPCIIASPIKSVKYLRMLFTNISNMNKKSIKLSPTVHRLRRPRILSSITPATPK